MHNWCNFPGDPSWPVGIQLAEAAQLYEAAGSYDQAASLYILDTNFEAAAPLMAKISTPKLHLQFAKAKESRGSYQDGGWCPKINVF